MASIALWIIAPRISLDYFFGQRGHDAVAYQIAKEVMMTDYKKLARNVHKESDRLNTYIADFRRTHPLPKKRCRDLRIVS